MGKLVEGEALGKRSHGQRNELLEFLVQVSIPVMLQCSVTLQPLIPIIQFLIFTTCCELGKAFIIVPLVQMLN